MSSPTGPSSLILRGPFPDVALGATFEALADAVDGTARRGGGAVLRLRPFPGDADVPLTALARSDERLWCLADGTGSRPVGVAAAVAACRSLGVMGVVAPWIERVDDATAAVLHHLVDGGSVALVGTIAPDGVLPPNITALVVSDLVRVVDADAVEPGSVLGSNAPPIEAVPDLSELTPREREILGFVEEGWRDREIADRLNLSVRTVEGHVMRARRKLGAVDRTALRR